MAALNQFLLSPIFIFLIPLIGLLYGGWLIFWILKQNSGNQKMIEISKAIQEGSMAYLVRQYKVVGIVSIIIFLLLWILFKNWIQPFTFLIGALFSALAGFIGMMIATRSNSKVAEGARKSLDHALNIAFRGGTVTGIFVVSFGLLTIAGVWFIFHSIPALIALGFGASLISVFARLGGGIFTKSADVGADLVGKVELNIPEDDPRNPAVIADNVGDNVGDCAGMAADLYETYVVTIIAAMILGSFISSGLILLPLVIGSLAVIASIIGAFFVKLPKSKNIMFALYRGWIAAALISIILFILPANLFSSSLKENVLSANLSIWITLAIGIVLSGLMAWITEYYTSKPFSPVKKIAQASTSGHGTNVIMGLAVGLESTFWPILSILAATLVSYWLLGLYGIALAALSMLSIAGIIIAIDSFGPITDNAGGIAEMSQMEENVRKNADELDAVGNTTKAVTKTYAIASAGLAALVLFSAYTQEFEFLGKTIKFELQDPIVLTGLFLGAAIPFLFCSLAMRSVSRAATKVVEEVRRQFREISGLAEGTAKPQYGHAVDIVTRAALKEMIAPALLPILIIILTGLFFGAKAVGGLLMGVIISGLFVAISMSIGGAAWDNAKKLIESGAHGGKGSFAHQAAVTGDTVGDVYKDTAGPAINPMIKVLNIVALLLVKFFK